MIPEVFTLPSLGHYSMSQKRLPNEPFIMYKHRLKLIKKETKEYLWGNFVFVSKSKSDYINEEVSKQKGNPIRPTGKTAVRKSPKHLRKKI